MSIFRTYAERWRLFNSNVRRFLIFDVSYQIAVAVYALYFPRYLLALGHREDTLGSLLAAGTLCTAIFATLAGLVSDRIGRKRSLIIGISISKAAYFARGFLVFIPALYASFIIDGLFVALYSAASNPFIFENTTDEERIHAFSLQGMFLRVAGIAGNILAGFLPRVILLFAPQLDKVGVYRAAFSFALVVALYGIYNLFQIGETSPARANGSSEHKRRYHRSPLRLSLRGLFNLPRRDMVFLGKYVLSDSFLALGAGHFMPFMQTYFIARYNASPEEAGVITSLAQAAVIIGIAIAPVLGERFGITRSVLLTRLIALPLLIFLAFAPNLLVVALIYSLRNATQQMSGPLTNHFMLDNLDRNARATANGVLQTFNAGVRALAMYSAGMVITRYGYPWIFIIAFTTYSVSAALFWAFFVRRDAASSREPAVMA
ncbi:MAG: MFS transporter [Bacillota bacterium]